MTNRLTGRGRWRRVRRVALWLAAIVLVCWTLESLWRRVLADRLLRRVLNAQGLWQVSAQVQQAGLFHAHVGPVRLGGATDAPQVADVELRYSPASLLRRTIHEIRIRGVRATFALSDSNAMTVAGLDPGLLALAAKPSAAPAQSWRVGMLAVDAGILLRRAADEPLTATASVLVNAMTGSLYRLNIEAAMEGVELNVAGQGDPACGVGRLRGDVRVRDLATAWALARRFSPEILPSVCPVAGGASASVAVERAADAAIRVAANAQVADGLAALSAHGTLARQGVGWRLDASGSGRVARAAFALWLPPRAQWLGDDPRLAFDARLAGADLRSLDGPVTWQVSTGAQQVRADAMALSLHGAQASGCVEIAASRACRASADAACDAIHASKGGLSATKRVRLRGSADAPFTNVTGVVSARLDELDGPFGRVAGELARGELTWQVGLVSSGLVAGVEGTLNVSTSLVAGVSGGRVNLSAPAVWQVHGGVACSGRQVALEGVLDLGELSGRSGAFSYGATGAVIRVSAATAPSADLRGTVEGRGGWLRDSGPSALELDGLSFFLPLPMHVGAADAERQPASLNWQRLEAGGVALQPGDFSLTGGVDRCDVTLTTRVVGSALAVHTRVHADWHGVPSAEVTVDMPDVRLGTNDSVVVALSRRTGTDVTFVGMVGGRLAAALQPGRQPEFRGAWRVRDATATSVAKQWQVSGLSVSAALAGRSPDDWRIDVDEDTRFGSAMAGNLTLTNGFFRWAATPRELFVERGGFGWCGGAVRLYAVHVALNNPEAECVLYIDQVDLGQLLKQMQVLQGTGSGTLYGRLPLRLQGGTVKLSDGFLYSLPGQGGRLRVTNTEYVAQVLSQANIPALVRDRLIAALTDLDFSLFRMDLEPPAAGGDALLKLRIAGQAHAKPGEPPVDLNVNIKGPLEQLFNMGLKLR